MDKLRAEAAKTFGGTLIGLALLLAGWAIFLGNGFSSAFVFFIGILTLPTGILVLATAVTGGLGETPWRIISYYRNKQRRS